MSDPRLYTTLRLIEKVGVCSAEYYSFLEDFGGAPVDVKAFPHFKSRKKFRVGPDDRIYLSDILKKKSSSLSLSGADRVEWLISHAAAKPSATLSEASVLLTTLEYLASENRAEIATMLLSHDVRIVEIRKAMLRIYNV